MEESKHQIIIGPADKAHLVRAGKWARFIAIVQFVALGCAALALIGLMLAIFAAKIPIPGMYGQEAGGAFMTIYFIVLFCILIASVFPAIYTLQFADNALKAVAKEDDAAMTRSLENLGKLFRFQGILMIAIFALYILMIPVVMIAGM